MSPWFVASMFTLCPAKKYDLLPGPCSTCVVTSLAAQEKNGDQDFELRGKLVAKELLLLLEKRRRRAASYGLIKIHRWLNNIN